MTVTRTPRTEWIDRGLRALASGGPEAVRVESLAADLGVTKGGFYWHVGDRGALLDEMLDAWERVMLDDVVDLVEREGGDARARLRRLFAIGRAGPVARGRTALSPRGMLKIDLAVRDWARRDKSVAKRLARVDNRRVDYMRSLFSEICSEDADVEARCFLAMTLFVGSSFVAVDHGPRSRAEVLELALEHLLAQ
jgi:AcrR family transcriptional regulator